MTPLFLPEVDPHAFFEKQASIAKMPDDDTKWPAHVLSNLHQQLPFLSQYEVDLSLQRVEPEAGFAFGHALLMAKNDPAAATESKNPQNMIKIPVIIADRQLQPFHTFELSGNVYPLTSERIEAALLNPAVFEGPARKPHRQKSLIDQMYPPYQQRQGFGRTVGAGTSSMGVTKLSSASRESLEADLREMSGHLGAVDYKNQSRKSARRKIEARIEDLKKPQNRNHLQKTMGQAGAGFAAGGLTGGFLGLNRGIGPVKGALIGGGIGAGLGALEAQRKGSKQRQAKGDARRKGFYARTRDSKYRDMLIQRSLDGAGKRASAPQSSDAFSMDPERLRRIAKLRSKEREDRYQTEKGTGGRLKSSLKSMALPVGVGLTAAGLRGGFAARKGGRDAILAGAKKGLAEGALVSGASSAANIALKERGLSKRQQQRAEVGMPRVGTLEDPKSYKAASASQGIAAAGAVGAGLMGGRSFLRNKDEALKDIADYKSGKMSKDQLNARLKGYGLSTLIDTGAGAGIGAGGAAAFRAALPELRRAAQQAGESVDSRLQQSVRGAAREVVPGLAEGAADKTREVKSGVADRLRNLFRRGE